MLPSIYRISAAYLLVLPSLIFAQDDDPAVLQRLELGAPYQAEHFSSLEASRALIVAPVAPASDLVGYDHGDPTNFEQLMLERVNRARLDPGAEAARLGIDLNEGLAPGTIVDSPKPPLAPNLFLTASARTHSGWMLLADIFSHTGESGSTPSDRMLAAGYDLSGSWSTGENIAWSGSTGPVDLGQLTQEMHEGLFISPGHRINICGEGFQEIGVGINEGLFFSNGTNWNAGMATQNFARSSATPGPFVTGVVYQDDNQNGLYDLGEGMSGIVVTLSGSSYYAESSASGGYALPVGSAAGNQEVTFTGEAWEESRSVLLELGTNLKADLVVEEAAPVWYDGASEIQPAGWRYFGWFKGFKPEGENWIYHGRHGWLYTLGEDTSSLFLWDVALGRWIFTNETIYPWMYAYGSGGGWVFFFEGGRPGSRFFKRGDTAAVVSEQDLRLN